ncbi:MAG: aminopeptidase P family protein, partial [Candidatus Eremiobacterota bacterium]
FCGWNQASLVAVLEEGRCTLYYDFPSVEDAVWHGPGPTREDLEVRFGYDRILPRKELDLSGPVTSLPVVRCAEQADRLGRMPDLERDRDLALAVIDLRLRQDPHAVEQLRAAGEATVAAHRAGMAATRPGATEWEVRAAMELELARRGMGHSYAPIVSTHGEVLHNPHCDHTLAEGDLLLVDLGAETGQGWAGDVTRTWPATGRFTPRQRDIYRLVLEAQREAIAAVRPGVRYRDLHLGACRTLAEGLVELGLLKGDPDSLVERGAHALFFPHGLGHLLGLDVHDMEDLGDLAGYAPGRSRSDQFGLCYLRMDRDLEPGMAFTVEPGFYWIPQLLENSQRTDPFRDCLDVGKVQEFREVRGIRIEDDVLVTGTGVELLTPGLPGTPDEVEAAVLQVSF